MNNTTEQKQVLATDLENLKYEDQKLKNQKSELETELANFKNHNVNLKNENQSYKDALSQRE